MDQQWNPMGGFQPQQQHHHQQPQPQQHQHNNANGPTTWSNPPEHEADFNRVAVSRRSEKRE